MYEFGSDDYAATALARCEGVLLGSREEAESTWSKWDAAQREPWYERVRQVKARCEQLNTHQRVGEAAVNAM